MPRYKNFIYTDQLLDTEIDLTAYLERFSNDTYELEFQNIQPVVATVKNLFNQINLVEDFKERGVSYFVYNIREGELPEDVALKHYNSVDFWWVVLLFNDIKSPLTQWPLTEEQIDYVIDDLVAKENKYTRQAYYDLLFNLNEQRRPIELIKQDQLPDLITQFRNSIVLENTLGERFNIVI